MKIVDRRGVISSSMSLDNAMMLAAGKCPMCGRQLKKCVCKKREKK